MCGICGVLNLTENQRTDRLIIQRMLAMVRHRGPDGIGIYSDDHIAMGNARLSIIDLKTGDQPICNEDESLWIVLNGEIFNYLELRRDLEKNGHSFKTQSDTEVILHAFEEHGKDCLNLLNGQFSLAIWDNKNHSLFMARDRLGITPLYYKVQEKHIIFASEIKALLAYPGIKAEIDPVSLQQVFSFWSVQTPRSIFAGVSELPPGHYLHTHGDQISVEPYWSLDFSPPETVFSEDEYLEKLEGLLTDSVRLRLRSDVPVGVYLSGGLDSSIITSLVCRQSNYPLETFSISFSDPEFDESIDQIDVSNYFHSRHHVVNCNYEDVGVVFPEVIWHAETPLLRTAPAPMFLLSKLVTTNRYKVVLTGEGADEFFGGYDIFKEAQLRRFWARNPSSTLRPLLFKKLYKDLGGFSNEPIEYLKAFYKKGLLDTDSPYYSHALRWNNTARNFRFLKQAPEFSGTPEFTLPKGFNSWSHFAKAQFIETTTFLSPYLLSSQGDRMAMANSVELRQPYLDYRLIEFCNRLPESMKLRGLKEKWLLKRFGAKLLPEKVWNKLKKPYRAPIHQCFFAKPPGYVKELLSEKQLDENGYFNTKAVLALLGKASMTNKLGEIDSMAVAGIISTQLLHQLFIKDFQRESINSNDIKYIEK